MNSSTNAPAKFQLQLSPLRWYTGYYSLVGAGGDSVGAGAYLQIISSGNENSLFDIASIAISTNGTTVVTHTSGFTIDNIHNMITIPDVCSITLVKNNNERAVSTLHGTVNNLAVTGANYLSPAPLEILAGSYKTPATGNKEILSIVRNTSGTGPVFNITFDFGSGAQVISDYTYDPTMYLLSFDKVPAATTPEKYVLMLGTGEGKGLACYVVGSGNPIQDTVLYTIPG